MGAVVAPERTVELRSFYASGYYVVEPSEDGYDAMGRRRTLSKGKVIKFLRGRATVPAEWMEAIEAFDWFGVEVFRADDVRAPEVRGGPRVVEGTVSVTDRAKPGPPTQDWNTAGPRELRGRIQAGEVGDPVKALTYEAQGKRREQVMTALAQAIARKGGAPMEPEPEPTGPAEPFTAELPAGAKGV